jgi:MYXO-CTERM domain-containing protein
VIVRSGLGFTTRKLDLLFVIDNSASMMTSQANLRTNLPGFMDVFKNLKDGLPDLHIAVVTSNLGANDGVTSCAGEGDAGAFQFSPRPPCTDTTLAPGATFIADSGGTTPITNFTEPDITNVLGCIVAVGDQGCGYEHQLGAAVRALGADGRPPPPGNEGFLRPDAILDIVFLTNEDDCTAPPGSPLFDVDGNTNLASHFGPPTSYRCNEFGHLCGTPPLPPPRLSPNPADAAATVTLEGCKPAEGSGILTPVAELASEILSLKSDPDAISVVAIAGPATPYTVHWTPAPTADSGPWPAIMHSCDNGPDVGTGDPSVRIQEFVRAFGDNGSIYSICQASFAPALNQVVEKLVFIPGPDAGGDGATTDGAGGGGAGEDASPGERIGPRLAPRGCYCAAAPGAGDGWPAGLVLLGAAMARRRRRGGGPVRST